MSPLAENRGSQAPRDGNLVVEKVLLRRKCVKTWTVWFPLSLGGRLPEDSGEKPLKVGCQKGEERG